MSTNPKLGFPELAEGQGSPEITVNEADRLLSAMAILEIISRTLTTPDGGEANGYVYLVAAGATGDWLGHDGELAYYFDGWTFVPPAGGMRGYVKPEAVWIAYDASGAEWYLPEPHYLASEEWTGRYDGASKIYRQTWTITAPAASATVTTAHGITNLDLSKRVAWHVDYYAAGLPAFPAPSAAVDHSIDAVNIVLVEKSAFNWSPWTVGVTLEYSRT